MSFEDEEIKGESMSLLRTRSIWCLIGLLAMGCMIGQSPYVQAAENKNELGKLDCSAGPTEPGSPEKLFNMPYRQETARRQCAIFNLLLQIDGRLSNLEGGLEATTPCPCLKPMKWINDISQCSVDQTTQHIICVSSVDGSKVTLSTQDPSTAFCEVTDESISLVSHAGLNSYKKIQACMNRFLQ